MSYKIVFKGNVPEEYVDDVRGHKLAEMWQSDQIRGRIRINDNIYESTSIKAILSGFNDPETSTKHSANIEEITKLKREYEEDKTRLLKQSPEERGKNTGLAEMLFKAFGTDFSEEKKAEVIHLQQQFFTENPEYSQAKPTVYKHLLDHPLAKAYSLKEHLPYNALALAERVVAMGISQE